MVERDSRDKIHLLWWTVNKRRTVLRSIQFHAAHASVGNDVISWCWQVFLRILYVYTWKTRRSACKRELQPWPTSYKCNNTTFAAVFIMRCNDVLWKFWRVRWTSTINSLCVFPSLRLSRVTSRTYIGDFLGQKENVYIVIITVVTISRTNWDY